MASAKKEEYQKANEYDGDVFDNEIDMVDIKINPAYYIHQCLRNIQISLIDENISAGVFKYSHFVEMLEILGHSSKMIPNKESYETKLKQKIEEAKLDNLDTQTKIMKKANIKFSILCTEIFENKDVYGSLKMGSHKK